MILNFPWIDYDDDRSLRFVNFTFHDLFYDRQVAVFLSDIKKF